MSQRIKAISDAATSLFLTQGYSKSQISHIAKAVGVSVGTIYNDFIGKKEIMLYILKTTIDPDFVNKNLKYPISEINFIGLEQDIVDVFSSVGNEFSKYLTSDIKDYSFESLISDAFDILSRYAVGCLFIEKNQYDFKFLSDNYKIYRKNFLNTMMDYIRKFMGNGIIRDIENVELTTVLIVEILSWWTMDRRYTSFETNDIPAEIAKKVCMDNIISAYKK